MTTCKRYKIYYCMVFNMSFEFIYVSKKQNIIFDRFPSEPERKEKWLKNLRRKDWQPSKHSKICSDHFTESNLNRTYRRVKLREDAIPTRFKQFPNYLKKVYLYVTLE